MNILILSSFLFVYLRCSTVYIRIFIFLIFVLYSLHSMKANIKTVVLTTLFMSCYLFPSMPNEFASDTGIIVETRLNTAIAQFDNNYVLIYTNQPLSKNTTIKRTGTCSTIESLSNHHQFDYEKFYRNRNIHYSCNQDEYEIIKENDNIQNFIYNQIKQINNQTNQQLLLSIFYQQYQNNHLLTSTGLHISYINQWILTHIPHGNIIATLICLVLGYNLPFSISYIRCIVSNLLSIFKKKLSNKELLGYEMLIMMFIYPGCVHEIGFILPIAIKFISLFNISKSKFTTKAFLVWFQCQIFFEYDVLSIFMYSFYQIINTMLFIISSFVILYPSLEFLLYPFHIFNYLPQIHMTGSFPFILTIPFIYLLYQLMKQDSYKIKIIMIIILICTHLQAYIDPFYEVTFLNVGQGDCILIELPFHLSTILIDIPKGKEEIVLNECKAKGIHKIDTLIITHDDQDHSGGKEQLIDKIQINQIIENKQDINTSLISMKCLNQKDYDNDNDNSLVYMFEIHGLKYLMMADVSQTVEKDLVSMYDLDCDIVKIGHHGSKTSTSSYFIQQILPKIAIISCSKNNVYGHPHYRTLNTLNNYDVDILNTSTNGAISIKSFLNIHLIHTSQNEYKILISQY